MKISRRDFIVSSVAGFIASATSGIALANENVSESKYKIFTERDKVEGIVGFWTVPIDKPKFYKQSVLKHFENNRLGLTIMADYSCENGSLIPLKSESKECCIGDFWLTKQDNLYDFVFEAIRKNPQAKEVWLFLEKEIFVIIKRVDKNIWIDKNKFIDINCETGYVGQLNIFLRKNKNLKKSFVHNIKKVKSLKRSKQLTTIV